MSRFFDLVSKPAREMSGFPPAPAPRRSALDPQPRLIKLDSNENPFGPSPRALEAMQLALGAANSYPDDDCSELGRKLAAYHDVPNEQVLVTAGSTALLGLLCQTMLAPGLNAVTSERSFTVYAMAVRAVGAELIEAPMLDDGLALDAILEAINEDTRIVFLANPNNPTGTMLAAEPVDKFIAEVPGHVVVVLDEAYYEFASYFAMRRKVEYSGSLKYLRQGGSVVVLRTFSKAHGLAGLRVGYGLGPAELLAYCARMRDTFSVSTLAQAAAVAALDDVNHVGRVVSNNAEQAQILGVGLSELGYRVVPTAANFLYCDLGEDALGFAERLRGEGVSVRPLGGWGAPECIRVSIGTPEQNQVFLRAARKLAGTT
ncbi:MAG TPA: histidinol-phosphate transaminase [Candidatus Sulfotelmatobacter sp.]